MTLAFLALAALFAARLDSVAEREIEGRAVAGDGDSLTIAGERIRLIGIDAPELAQTCSRAGADRPCGRESRDALTARIRDRVVICSGWERDRYNRLLARCRAGGVDLNRAQVEDGWAVAYGDHADAEAAARGAGRGLWAGRFERPREWRTRHGGMVETEHGAINRLLNWVRQAFRWPWGGVRPD